MLLQILALKLWAQSLNLARIANSDLKHKLQQLASVLNQQHQRH